MNQKTPLEGTLILPERLARSWGKWFVDIVPELVAKKVVSPNGPAVALAKRLEFDLRHLRPGGELCINVAEPFKNFLMAQTKWRWFDKKGREYFEYRCCCYRLPNVKQKPSELTAKRRAELQAMIDESEAARRAEILAMIDKPAPLVAEAPKPREVQRPLFA